MVIVECTVCVVGWCANMGGLRQLVVSRRYGRSRCAPEQKKRDWTRKTLVRRGNPSVTLTLPKVVFKFLRDDSLLLSAREEIQLLVLIQ